MTVEGGLPGRQGADAILISSELPLFLCMDRLYAAPRSLSQPSRPCLSALGSFCRGWTKRGVKATYKALLLRHRGSRGRSHLLRPPAGIPPLDIRGADRLCWSQGLLQVGGTEFMSEGACHNSQHLGTGRYEDVFLFFFFSFGIDIAAGDTM